MEMTICGVSGLWGLSAHGFSHVISIWDTGQSLERAREKMAAHFPSAELHLCQIDELYGVPVEVTKAAIHAALAFADGVDSLLVHCQSGISRAPAVGLAILCQSTGPGREAESFAEILRICPAASPNRLIVRFADDVLSREDAMTSVNEEFHESRCGRRG